MRHRHRSRAGADQVNAWRWGGTRRVVARQPAAALSGGCCFSGLVLHGLYVGRHTLLLEDGNSQETLNAMKVFIPSVAHLLSEERAALPPFLRLLGHEGLRREDFAAQNRSSRQACLAGVEEAEVYVLLLGPKYGDPFPHRTLTHRRGVHQSPPARKYRSWCSTRRSMRPRSVHSRPRSATT